MWKENGSLWGVGSVREGKPPARVSPLFGVAENSPFPALFCAWGVSASADADQGLCPWTLVAFEKAPQNFMRPAALVFASVCVYEQNRCFPMTVNSGLDQIQALVAVTGLK